MDILAFDPLQISALIGKFFEFAFAIIAIASAVTALTPTPRDDVFVGKLYKFIEALALNIGHAKDAPANRGGGRFVAK